MIWHIVPLNDIKEHADGSDCDCHPVLEEQGNGDFLCIHNAWDKREIREEEPIKN